MLKSGNHTQGGRFAATGGPQHREKFALTDCQRRVFHRCEPGELLGDVLKFDGREIGVHELAPPRRRLRDDSLPRRCNRSATINRVMDITITSTASATTCGKRLAKRSWPKMNTGSVALPPLRNEASTNSSKEIVNATSQDASTAGAIRGMMTRRRV